MFIIKQKMTHPFISPLFIICSTNLLGFQSVSLARNFFYQIGCLLAHVRTCGRRFMCVCMYAHTSAGVFVSHAYLRVRVLGCRGFDVICLQKKWGGWGLTITRYRGWGGWVGGVLTKKKFPNTLRNLHTCTHLRFKFKNKA